MKVWTTKAWPVRLSNCIFIIPEYTYIDLEHFDKPNNKILVRFSDRDVDWINQAIVIEYTNYKDLVKEQ